MLRKSLLWALAGAASAAFAAGAEKAFAPPPTGQSVNIAAKSNWSDALLPGLTWAEPQFTSTYAEHPTVTKPFVEHAEVGWNGPIFQRNPLNEAPAVQDDGVRVQAPDLAQVIEGVGQTTLTPPDPSGAMGPVYGITAVNDVWAITDRLGNVGYSTTIGAFVGDPNGFFFDPRVFYDPWNGRYVMLYLFKSSNASQLVVLISDDDNPYGNWTYYRFNAATNNGTQWADYYAFGYSSDAVYAGGNQYTFSGNSFAQATIRTWDKAQIYNGQSAGMYTDGNLINQDGSSTFAPRPAFGQVQPGGWNGTFFNTRPGGGNRVTVWKMADPFGAHTLSQTDYAVGSYSPPPSAKQPNGVTIATNDCRSMGAVLSYDETQGYRVLLASGTSSSFTWSGDSEARSVLRPFIIDMSNNTVMLDQMFGGPGYYYWFPSPGADYAGGVLWVFARTAPQAGAFAEARYVDWKSGGSHYTGSVPIKAGESNYSGGRWGDYFEGSLDWSDYGGAGTRQKIWLYGEYAAATPGNWATAWGASTFGVLGSMDVAPDSGWQFTGTEGGPFSPSSGQYVVSNPGEVGIDFQVTDFPSWLDVDNTFDQVASGQSRDVNFGVNAEANSLSYGVYYGFLNFRTYLGASQQRYGSLVVGARRSAESFNVFRGSLLSGGVPELAASDDTYLVVKNGPVALPSESPITVTFDTTAPGSTASAIVLNVENRVSINNLRQTIDQFDWTSGSYVLLDTQGAPTTDLLLALDLSSPDRFIQSGTNLMRARLRIKPAGPLFTNSWTASTDLIAWDFTP